MASKKKSVNLHKLAAELTPESIAKLSNEEIIKIKKILNPYSSVIEGAGNFLTFSITNMEEKYMDRLKMTSLIGYLNRALDEWHVSSNIPVVPVGVYMKDPDTLKKMTSEWKMTPQLEAELKENEQWMRRKVIIKQFFMEVLEFNPDMHVRSAYRPQPQDAERFVINCPAANASIEHLKKIDPKFRTSMLEYDRGQQLIAMRERIDIPEMKDVVSREIIVPDVNWYFKDYSSLSEVDAQTLSRLCNAIPPDDIFARWRRYERENLEKIKEAVLHLYCEKPELAFCIQPYAWHASADEAIDFQKKHREEVITDIYTAASGKWTILESCKENRSATRFFNENTIVLEEIMQQIERDAKIGKDLMQNRISRAKKENIARDGPDAESFVKWKESNPDIVNFNKFNQSSQLPQDMPDNSVAVDVWKMSAGGLNVEKSTFFTKAEAPAPPPAGGSGPGGAPVPQ